MATAEPVTCAYCGMPTQAPTRDHVVPSTLWGGRGFRPQHPVVVPACVRCQQEYDCEAEYFRNCIVAMVDRNSHPVAERVLTTSLIRSLERSQRAVSELFRRYRLLPRRTPSGIITGFAPGFAIDLGRINRVVEKIVRGIYYAKSGTRLPPEYEVGVYEGNGFWEDEHTRDLISAMCPAEGQGDDVFCCRDVRDNGDPNRVAWLLIFYGRIGFFALIERIAGHEAERATQ